MAVTSLHLIVFTQVIGAFLSHWVETRAVGTDFDMDGSVSTDEVGVFAVGESRTADEGGSLQYFNTLNANEGTYQFGYDTGLAQHQSFREEARAPDGSVHGVYGYVDSGVLRITEYTADSKGYRCRQTVHYLVRTERSTSVADRMSLKEGLREDETNSSPTWSSEFRGKGAAPRRQPKLASRPPPQPARVLGRKVAGHYKDVTSEPAIGGTAAVWAWDSAHDAVLTREEVAGPSWGRFRNTRQVPSGARDSSPPPTKWTGTWSIREGNHFQF